MIKNLEIEDYEKPATLIEIRNFEQLIKAQLPKDYIEFLLKYNGGYPLKNCYPLIEPIDNDIERGSGADIHFFLTLENNCYINIINIYKIFLYRIPNELIPIAYGSGGDKICLGISDSYYGKIYFWDHENEAPDGVEPWYDNVYLIANSFTDFINSLYSIEIDDEGNILKRIY